MVLVRRSANSADSLPDGVSSWMELAALVEHVSRFSRVDWLFRGVVDEAFPLIPKVGRERVTPLRGPKRTPYSIADERAVFKIFVQQARAHLSKSHTDIEWLAIAQHFGVPTRFLDWSDSPLVAAWFAVQQADREGCDAAIWVTRGVDGIKPSAAVDPMAVKTVHIYRPPHLTPRMSSQGSVLMLCPTPTKEVAPTYLRKIRIDGKQRYHFRKRLNASGFNARTLFADLGGLGEHLAWLYKTDALAGYRKVEVDPDEA
jgi:hypothetical protein